MKKILSTLTAITLLAGATAINASAFTPSSYATDLKVYLNGENVYAGSENQPCIMNDRTMVQIRPIFEKLGYTAQYDDATKTAVFYSNRDNTSISFTNGSYTLGKLSSEDGSIAPSANLDVPATIYNDTFYVPLRAFCDAVISLSIDWDSASRSAYVTDNAQVATHTATSSVGQNEFTIEKAIEAIRKTYDPQISDYDIIETGSTDIIIKDKNPEYPSLFKVTYYPNGISYAQDLGLGGNPNGKCYGVALTGASSFDYSDDTNTSVQIVDENYIPVFMAN